MQDHTLKPRWGLIDIIIVYAAAVLLTLFAGRALAHILIDPVTLFISGAVLQSLIIIGLVLIFTLYINRARLADLGIKKPAGKQLLLYGLLGGALLMVLMVILGIPIAKLQPQVQPQLFEQMLRGWGRIQAFFLISFRGSFRSHIRRTLLPGHDLSCFQRLPGARLGRSFGRTGFRIGPLGFVANHTPGHRGSPALSSLPENRQSVGYCSSSWDLERPDVIIGLL